MSQQREREVVFPNEIPVDPDKATKAIFVHVDEGLFAPHSMAESLRRVDDLYTADRSGRFRFMAKSVITGQGLEFDRMFAHDERDANSRDLLVVLSPLNDGRPESSADTVTGFVTADSITRSDTRHAKPNSHRPAAKLDVDYEFGHAEGLGMPRYQIFAREAPAMTWQQRRRVAAGDMTPYGELALSGIGEAERIKHETYGTGGFDNIHFFAAGMGAKALGAAVALLESPNGHRVGSVTLMNFALGEQSLTKLGRDYTGRRMVGEASDLILPENYVRVPELSVLSELDRDTEFAMRIRQAKALINIRMVRAIMNAKQGVSYIEHLMDNGSTVTIANGLNEAMVAETDHYLPIGDGLLRRTHIVGVDGKKVGQAANEHGAAVAVVSNLGIYNHRSRQAS